MATILLLEDKSEARDDLHDLLERDGHKVTAADDGRQAAKLVADESFAILIASTGMPELEALHPHVGPGAADRGELKVIALAPESDPPDAAAALGADRVLPRPVLTPILLRCIDDLLV